MTSNVRTTGMFLIALVSTSSARTWVQVKARPVIMTAPACGGNLKKMIQHAKLGICEEITAAPKGAQSRCLDNYHHLAERIETLQRCHSLRDSFRMCFEEVPEASYDELLTNVVRGQRTTREMNYCLWINALRSNGVSSSDFADRMLEQVQEVIDLSLDIIEVGGERKRNDRFDPMNDGIDGTVAEFQVPIFHRPAGDLESDGLCYTVPDLKLVKELFQIQTLNPVLFGNNVYEFSLHLDDTTPWQEYVFAGLSAVGIVQRIQQYVMPKGFPIDGAQVEIRVTTSHMAQWAAEQIHDAVYPDAD